MKKLHHFFKFWSLSILLAVTAQLASASTSEVRIGVLAFRPVDITLQQWQPTADYLNAHVPGNHFSIVPLNYKELDLAVNRLDFDFVITNPEHYVSIRKDHGLIAIATLMPLAEGHPVTTFGGVIFTRADRFDINTLEDVRGKVISSPSEQSLGGYLMQRWALYKSGITTSELGRVNFTGMPHDNAVIQVLEGKADVGFARTGVLEGMAREGKIKLGQFKVLNLQPQHIYPQLLSTELYPEWPVTAEIAASPALVKQVTLALMNIQHDDVAAQKGKYYGFSPTEDYSLVESLMLRLKINPGRSHEFDLRDIARIYATQITLISFLIIMGVISTALYLAKTNSKLRKSNLERERLDEELRKSNVTLEDKVLIRTRELQESEAISKNTLMELQFQKLALDEHAIVSTTDITGIITYANDRLCEISKYSRDELLGHDHRMLNSGLHSHDFFREMYHQISRGKIWHNEVCNRAKDGSLFWVDMTIVPFKNEEGILSQYIAIRTDITARKQSEQEIQRLAFYDPLTDLPNRRLLMDRLQHTLSTNIRNDRHGAIMFIDLDNFKDLNDTQGHGVGDLLLIEVAKRLKACVRDEDTVARLGGDEFVLLLENLSLNHIDAMVSAERVAEKIMRELNRPYLLNSFEHHSSPSIGITLFCDSTSNIDDLIKNADTAMYQAKNAGRNAVRFYDPATQRIMEQRIELERALHGALSNEQLQLYYQVQVDENHIPIGAEALLRWNHPVLGAVSPAVFIPVAEETGLIIPIGYWVLQTACHQLKKWEHNELASELVLAVNVSVRQFREPDFVIQVKSLIEKSGINPAKLKLEITESMVMNHIESTIDTMQHLKALGLKFSMDDFGTGYSSLSNIKRLPLDQLKIDQSFVRDILHDANDKAIVRTIIAMANSMNLSVIAEGVETDEQKRLLVNKGCRSYQGYYFGKPMPIEQFEDCLQNG
jgi:diguanylate cyclase (GGDEF)-like protein/PAS domain S-box-containing protein